jgi:hypothetical protein
MRSVGAGCLRWTILYLFLAASAAALVYARVPERRLAVGTGCGAALLLWLGLAYVSGVRERHREATLVRQAIDAGRPEDGQKIAVAGVVRGVGTVHAPLSGKRCVLYEYKALAAGREQVGAVEGFALSPLAIDGARGSIRLLAAPELAFDEEQLDADTAQRNLTEYMARTQFIVHEGIDINRELAHVRSVMADDDGHIRYDIRRETPGPNLSAMSLREKVLAPGEHVVAIGRYSSARGGLVPDPSAALYPVKLFKGSPDAIAKKLRSRDRVDVPMSCGCILPVFLAAAIALIVLPLGRIEEQYPKKLASWPEVRLEQWLDRRVRPKLAPFGVVQQDSVAAALPMNTARGRLSDGQRSIELRTAAARRDGNIVEITLSGGIGGAIVRLRLNGDVASVGLVGGETLLGPDATAEDIVMEANEIRGRITCITDGVKMRATFRSSL